MPRDQAEVRDAEGEAVKISRSARERRSGNSLQVSIVRSELTPAYAHLPRLIRYPAISEYSAHRAVWPAALSSRRIRDRNGKTPEASARRPDTARAAAPWISINPHRAR